MDSSDDEFLIEAATQWEKTLLKNGHKDEFSEVPADIDDSDLPDFKYLKVLSQKFGHKKFRPLQWKIIKSVLIDKKDNCAIMTTGYGKSLCYQYPAVYSGGCTVVISPLISLMEDQVLALNMKDLSSCLLGTGQDKDTTTKKILENKYSVIYVTPEYCISDNGLKLLKNMYSERLITLIAIDEAHCVSSWGHDFRFSFRKLGVLNDMFPDIPVLAVTATATEQVRKDIVDVLKLKNPQIICSGFDRPNLYFSVKPKSSSIIADLKSVMIRRNSRWVFEGPTIIYCIRRKDTEEISDLLKMHNIDSLPYHAGMSLKDRKEAHEKFVKDQVPVIVATVAFGMGIDKPDIRNVIHYGASKSIESYYQEVGRAGRDGLPSKCITFYKNSDFATTMFLIQQSGNKNTNLRLLDKIKEYLATQKCRREFILSYFNDSNLNLSQKKSGCCDNCSQTNNISESELFEGLDEKGMYNFTEDAVKFLSAVEAMNEKFGVGMYTLFLKGSKSSKLNDRFKMHLLYGSGREKSEGWWKAIADFLENIKYLTKNHVNKNNFGYYTTGISTEGKLFLRLSRCGKKLIERPTSEILRFLKKKTHISGWISVNESSSSTATRKIGASISGSKNTVVPKITDYNDSEIDELIDDRLKLFRLLKNCRTELAVENNCMPYMIASDFILMEIAKKRPLDIIELLNMKIEGLTDAVISKFGVQLIKVVQDNTETFKGKKNTEEAKTSIFDILREYPIEHAKPRVEITYSLFNNGLNLKEIATKRGLAYSTVLNHIISGMKMGYPIKLEQLGVCSKVRTTIMQAINSLGGNYTLLTPIKNACPEEISYDQIKAVCAYLEVRAHLDKIGLPYKDFEDFAYNEIIFSSSDVGITETKPTTSKDDNLKKNSELVINKNMKLSIYDILRKHSKENIKLTSTEEVTYSFLKEGLSVEDISRERDLSINTVLTHLLNALKVGYSIKMEQLGVTPKVRSTIIQVVNNLGGDCSLLYQITKACPADISVKQVSVVCVYIGIRKHLHNLKIPYEEFEDFIYKEILTNITNENDELEDGFDDSLLALCDAMEKGVDNEADTNILNHNRTVPNQENESFTSSCASSRDFEPLCKKPKIENDIVFGSPPREISTYEVKDICLESETVNTLENKETQSEIKKDPVSKPKKTLPKWLSKKPKP